MLRFSKKEYLIIFSQVYYIFFMMGCLSFLVEYFFDSGNHFVALILFMVGGSIVNFIFYFRFLFLEKQFVKSLKKHGFGSILDSKHTFILNKVTISIRCSDINFIITHSFKIDLEVPKTNSFLPFSIQCFFMYPNAFVDSEIQDSLSFQDEMGAYIFRGHRIKFTSNNLELFNLESVLNKINQIIKSNGFITIDYELWENVFCAGDRDCDPSIFLKVIQEKLKTEKLQDFYTHELKKYLIHH